MHLPLNVNEGEGIALSEQYQVGTIYPVFILMNDEGNVIRRWTGYTGGATALISTLNQALADVTSIGDRLKRFNGQPTLKDALFLAKYYSDAGENLKAADLYRRAESLSGNAATDYSLDIFNNIANAVWKEMIPFNRALEAADEVLAAKRKNAHSMARVAKIMARIARKMGKTDLITKYLLAGINATAGSQISQLRESHELLRADYALHVAGDTTGAITLKKKVMGEGWQDNRDKFYEFAKWCLERKINLREAEEYARQTVNLVYPGRIRAMVLNTVAEIVYARGDIEKAIGVIKLAIEQEPENDFYADQLERFQTESAR